MEQGDGDHRSSCQPSIRGAQRTKLGRHWLPWIVAAVGLPAGPLWAVTKALNNIVPLGGLGYALSLLYAALLFPAGLLGLAALFERPGTDADPGNLVRPRSRALGACGIFLVPLPLLVVDAALYDLRVPSFQAYTLNWQWRWAVLATAVLAAAAISAVLGTLAPIGEQSAHRICIEKGFTCVRAPAGMIWALGALGAMSGPLYALLGVAGQLWRSLLPVYMLADLILLVVPWAGLAWVGRRERRAGRRLSASLPARIGIDGVLIMYLFLFLLALFQGQII